MEYFQCLKCREWWPESKIEKLQWSLVCPDSDCGGVVKCKAFYSRIGGEGSDRQIKALKSSFRERFVKKEMDDVRHKHGDAFTDAVRGAAVERIKKGEEPT